MKIVGYGRGAVFQTMVVVMEKDGKDPGLKVFLRTLEQLRTPHVFNTSNPQFFWSFVALIGLLLFGFHSNRYLVFNLFLSAKSVDT